MSKFNTHCDRCRGYWEFEDYDLTNKPLDTIKKLKVRNWFAEKRNIGDYSGYQIWKENNKNEKK